MTSYHKVNIDGLNIFYREAGNPDSPKLVLLHGFPSSSHMFRDLIPLVADRFHVIAPDYIGFGYSDKPSTQHFDYTFANVTKLVEKLLFEVLELERLVIFVQDYGAPVGFRLASDHPQVVTGIVVQNGNAYVEGISSAFDPLKPFWENRTPETELSVRSLLTPETTIFQYTHGVKDLSRISPDAYTFDQLNLNAKESAEIQLDLFHDYPSNVALYDRWHEYFRTFKPKCLIVWGQNDPFFTVAGAKAYLRDLPEADLHLLDTGHFALEEESELIADRICQHFAA